jgi:hypothetical protein|tara:strand:- start:348 stop:1127 length:780 start_codon:yes stop_codon:yes gene_type:complete
MAKEIITKEDQLPADLLDEITASAGEGTSFDSSEMQIPFIRIIQALSPQIKKKDPGFIEGADQGDAFNTVTNEHWSGEEGLVVIPCYQETKFLEFVPRDSGGGFMGEMEPSNPDLQNTERKGAREILPNGNELVKSDQHYCLILGDGGMFQPAIVDMKSSQLKVSRRWKTQIAMQKIRHPKTDALLTPAVFATMWKLTTTEESNDQGTWYNWSVTKHGLVNTRDTLTEAKLFREQVMKGAVKAVEETEPLQKNEDEVPF